MKNEEKHKGYFEGILQLRNPNEELLNYVYTAIQNDKQARIAQQLEVRGGIDIYLSSQRYLLALGKRINERFSGVLRTSRKLFTFRRAEGKKVYRVNVLFRLYPFKVHSTINMAGEEYEVIRIEKQVTLQHVKSGKKEQHRPEELERWI